MDSICCPMCKATVIIPGRLGVAYPGNPAVNFVPGGIPVSSSRAGVEVRFSSCLSCGHVWASLEPDKLRSCIQVQGDEMVRQWLDFLERGPDRDLPDVPEARRAAHRVAEIDALVLANQYPAATRRLRELAGVTWDHSVNAIRDWRGWKREQKLELFGWVSKESIKDDKSTPAEHPMRDPWLDG
jgi:hypothetical protein